MTYIKVEREDAVPDIKPGGVGVADAYPLVGDRDEEEFRRDTRILLVARAMEPPSDASWLSGLAPDTILASAEQPVLDRPRWLRLRRRHRAAG